VKASGAVSRRGAPAVRRIHRDPITGKPTDLYEAGKPLPFLSYASFDHYTDDDLPFGDWLCFPFAFVYAAKYGGAIVHGSVEGGFPKRRFEHAWVERGDVVTDSHLWENPATPTMRRADYYRVFKPKVDSRYRLDAYRDLVERHQHYGPFFGKRPRGGKARDPFERSYRDCACGGCSHTVEDEGALCNACWEAGCERGGKACRAADEGADEDARRAWARRHGVAHEPGVEILADKIRKLTR